MLCKLKTTTSSYQHRATDRETNIIQKSKHADVVEAHESMRKRLESSRPKDHDHIAEKGFNSLGHYNFAHKFVPMPQAMKIPDAKAAVDQDNPSMATGKSQEQEGGQSRSRLKESPLCYTDGHLSSHKSTKAESCSVVTLQKRTPEPTHYLLKKVHLRLE